MITREQLEQQHAYGHEESTHSVFKLLVDNFLHVLDH